MKTCLAREEKNEGDLERTERVAAPENVSVLLSEYYEILTNYTTYIKGADKMTQQVGEGAHPRSANPHFVPGIHKVEKGRREGTPAIVL